MRLISKLFPFLQGNICFFKNAFEQCDANIALMRIRNTYFVSTALHVFMFTTGIRTSKIKLA